MDIRKLQRTIVDGLEDVKAQNISVFNTEHLSALFERVIIASGTSNRQTKALASSVRDAVKGAGYPIPRTEGETNGEWIIIDCGAAVVHVMQPNIRDYYHLEEIWGDKPVNLKLGVVKKLVKASEPDAAEPTRARPAAKRAPARKSTVRPPEPAETPTRRARVPRDALVQTDDAPAAPVKRARRPAVKSAVPTARPTPGGRPASVAGQVSRVVGVKKVAARKTAVAVAPVPRPTVKRIPVKKAAVKRAAATKAPRRP